jgi:hypothetical protein
MSLLWLLHLTPVTILVILVKALPWLFPPSFFMCIILPAASVITAQHHSSCFG